MRTRRELSGDRGEHTEGEDEGSEASEEDSASWSKEEMPVMEVMGILQSGQMQYIHES